MSNILNNFKPIIKSDVSMYVECFGNDDYDTRFKKNLIIDQIKKDKNKLKREHYDNYRDYEMMLKEKYISYKQSLEIQEGVGIEDISSGSNVAPNWFKKAIKYNGEFVKYNGELILYDG